MKKLILIVLLFSCLFAVAQKPDYIRTPNGPNTIVDWNLKAKTFVAPHGSSLTLNGSQDTTGNLRFIVAPGDTSLYIRIGGLKWFNVGGSLIGNYKLKSDSTANSGYVTHGYANANYLPITDTTDMLSHYINLSQMGEADGVATLDAGGKIPVSQLLINLFKYPGSLFTIGDSQTEGTNNGDLSTYSYLEVNPYPAYYMSVNVLKPQYRWTNLLADSIGNTLINLGVGGTSIGWSGGTPKASRNYSEEYSQFNMTGNAHHDWQGIAATMMLWNDNTRFAYVNEFTKRSFYQQMQISTMAVIAKLIIDDYAGISSAGWDRTGTAINSWSTTGTNGVDTTEAGTQQSFNPFYLDFNPNSNRYYTNLAGNQYAQFTLTNKRAAAIFYETKPTGGTFNVIVNGITIGTYSTAYSQPATPVTYDPGVVWLEDLPPSSVVTIQSTNADSVRFLGYGWVEKTGGYTNGKLLLIGSTSGNNYVSPNEQIVRLAKSACDAVSVFKNYNVYYADVQKNWIWSTAQQPDDAPHITPAGNTAITEAFLHNLSKPKATYSPNFINVTAITDNPIQNPPFPLDSIYVGAPTGYVISKNGLTAGGGTLGLTPYGSAFTFKNHTNEFIAFRATDTFNITDAPQISNVVGSAFTPVIGPLNNQNWTGNTLIGTILAPVTAAGATGTVDAIIGGQALPSLNATGLTTKRLVGFQIFNQIVGGTVNNQTSLLLSASLPSGNWGVYNNISFPSFQSNPFQLGSVTPTAGNEELQVTGKAAISTIDHLSSAATNIITTQSVGGGPLQYRTTSELLSDMITFGTGVQTALGVNIGSGGSPILNGGILGTPSSGIATNLTGTAAALNIGGSWDGQIYDAGGITTGDIGYALVNKNSNGHLALASPSQIQSWLGTGDSTIYVPKNWSVGYYTITGARWFSGSSITVQNALYAGQISVDNSLNGNSNFIAINTHATGYGVVLGGGNASQFALEVRQYDSTDAFDVYGDGHVVLQNTLRLQGYTVSALPAAGTAGRTAYVTDALTPVALSTVTGGGSSVVAVFDNGTSWIVE